MQLTCQECGAITTLDAETIKQIRKELRTAADRKIIRCRCNRWDFVLAARLGKG